MSEPATSSESADRLRAALAALAPEDPARQAFEALVQHLDTIVKGPIITGGVSSGRDANIASVQNFITVTSEVTDEHTNRLAWLDRLVAFYGEPDEATLVASADLQPLLDDLRLRLAGGVLLWTAGPPPADLSDLEARSRVALLLWPLIAAPLTYGPWRLLPIRWNAPAEAVFGSALTHLVIEHQGKLRQLKPELFNLRLLEALAQPQCRGGIQRLLADLRDPARGGKAIAANQFARQVSTDLVPPAAATQATPLRLLAAGAAGALAGAGTIATLDLAVHHSDTVLSLLRRLVEQLQPSAAHAADRPATRNRERIVEPNRVHTPTGTLSLPISIHQWRDELNHRSIVFGQQGLREAPVPYWCYVPGGSYRIGGWEPGKSAAIVQLKAFWITRVPITVAQYRLFVAHGYAVNAKRWWTPEGWKWKNDQKREHPWEWDKPKFSRVAQPVIGVTWYEATAFCAWLAEQLSANIPQECTLRLPSEAEWEVAAAYDRNRQRRTYPWGNTAPTPERAVYDQDWQVGPPNVGTRPAGAADSGALDLAGTVWEWCASSYEQYPIKSATLKKDFTNNIGDVPLRGGAYWNESTYVRCGARIGGGPIDGSLDFGFRIVVAPRAH